jgi:hypothetical protein
MKPCLRRLRFIPALMAFFAIGALISLFALRSPLSSRSPRPPSFNSALLPIRGCRRFTSALCALFSLSSLYSRSRRRISPCFDVFAFTAVPFISHSASIPSSTLSSLSSSPSFRTRRCRLCHSSFVVRLRRLYLRPVFVIADRFVIRLRPLPSSFVLVVRIVIDSRGVIVWFSWEFRAFARWYCLGIHVCGTCLDFAFWNLEFGIWTFGFLRTYPLRSSERRRGVLSRIPEFCATAREIRGRSHVRV